MLLMTSNTRSGCVGQGRASFSAPRSGRSAAVGAQRRALTDDGAEGIRPRTLKSLCFVMVPREELQGCCTGTCSGRFLPKPLIR